MIVRSTAEADRRGRRGGHLMADSSRRGVVPRGPRADLDYGPRSLWDGSASPHSDDRLGGDDEEHGRAVELGTQGGDVDRPCQQLVAIPLELDLDDEAGDRTAVAAVEDGDIVGAVLGGYHLGQVDRAALDAVMIDGDPGARAQQLGPSLPFSRNSSTRIS